MNAADLRVFEAVARLGAMNRAASELNTVQSNVTARIRALEHDLGVKLFHRTVRGVVPTDAGLRLMPFAGRISRLLADARRAVEDDGAVRGALAIGSLESTAAVRLPHCLAAYASAYPDVDFVLVPGTTSESIERVLSHEVHGAFVCGPVRHPDLEEEVVFREELVVVTARPVRRLDAVLRQRQLKVVIFRLGCSYRQKLEDVLARRGVVGLRRLEFGSIDAILGAVAAGVGITLLPRSVVATKARAGTLSIHALPPDEAHVDTVFVRLREAFVPRALDAFLACVRGEYAKAAAE